jgi:hypothetical protein
VATHSLERLIDSREVSRALMGGASFAEMQNLRDSDE